VSDDGKVKLLVVEDEDALAKVLKLRLEIEGFAVTTAADGEEALDLVRKQPPDLVLCDLMMPVMDGKEFTRAMKTDAKLKAIPILILSALKREQEMEELRRLGADGFAAKPFDSKALTAQIRELLP
jgi:CheY-like chemotaxis protein